MSNAHATAEQAARAKNQGSKWIRPSKRLAIYLRDGMACTYCGATLEDGAQLTLDHIKPVNKGGTNGETNLVTACLCCNSKRQDKTVRAFATVEGMDVDETLARVRRRRYRSIKKLRVTAKQIIANRK